MASILSVGEIRGLAENSNTVTLPAGHTLDVSSGTVNGIDSFAYPDNLPAGAVVQKVTFSDLGLYGHNTSSYVEISSSLRASITPIYNNSKIVVHCHIALNPVGVSSNTLFGATIKRSVNGGSTFTNLSTDGGDGNTGSRWAQNGQWARRNNGYDSNDMNVMDWFAVDVPGTTGAVIYSPWMKQETSGTGSILINHSSGNTSNWGWHIPTYITIEEIKQ